MIRARVTSARLRAGHEDQVRWGKCEIRWVRPPRRGDAGVRAIVGRPVTVNRFVFNHRQSTEFRFRMGGKEMVWPADQVTVQQQDGEFTIVLKGEGRYA